MEENPEVTGEDKLPTKHEQDELVAVVQGLGLTYTSAIKILRHRRQFEEEVVEIGRVFKGLPWADAALAISKAMQQTFHWAAAKITEATFFSPEHPPRIIQVECGPNGERIGVPMGNFEIPMLDDARCSGEPNRQGDFFFTAQIKRKYSIKMEEMLNLAEKLARSESLYRGKALRFNVEHEEEGQPQNVITFMQLGAEEELVLSRHTEVHMQANLWTPIQKPKEAAALGVPLKRAMLLYGKYGVGKTLAAHRTAHISLEHGRTFIYVPKSEDLARAYEFADQVSPAVLFVEDVDRITMDKVQLSTLANVLDGVTSKGAGVYLVATTNHIDAIPGILLRPGRFDMHLELSVPDEPAIEKLIALYAPQITGKVKVAVEALEGQIPAVIREACERAKLYALTRGEGTSIMAQDLADAANGMQQEMDRIQEANADRQEKSVGDQLADNLRTVIQNGSGEEAQA